MIELPTRLKSCSECCLTRAAWLKIIHEPTEETLKDLTQESSQGISSGLFTLIENLLIEAEIDQEDEQPEVRSMKSKPPLPPGAISKIYVRIHQGLAGSHLKNAIHEDSPSTSFLITRIDSILSQLRASMVTRQATRKNSIPPINN